MTGKNIVIVTRPQAQAAPTASALKARGFVPLLLPVTERQITALPPLPAHDAVIFTSQNGVEASKGSLSLTRPVYAVGAATAQAAIEAGYSFIRQAKGSGAALVDLIKSEAESGATYLHLGGADLAVDVAADLRLAGIKAHYIPCYRMVGLSPVLDSLDFSNLLAVTFYSLRAAQQFEKLLEQQQISDKMGSIKALCLSPRIADSLTAPWGKKLCPHQATEEALLALLGDEA